MIKYQSGYKYQLVEFYKHQLPAEFIPKTTFETPFLRLDTSALLTIRYGYAWDGPSGPTIDTKNFMRGSLVHDAIAQLMRMGLIPQSLRKESDKELRKVCLEDGMSKIRAWWVYKGVRLGGGPSSSPKNKRKVLIAP